MTRYRLPDVLGGGEFEATEWWSGCAGADRQYRIAGTNVTVSVPSQSPLDEIPPALPEEPPDGSVVMFGDSVFHRMDAHAEIPGAWYQPREAIRFWWAGLCNTYYPGITPVRLVPDPFAEPIKLPWFAGVHRRAEVQAPDPSGGIYVLADESLGPVEARAMARALWTAADAAEAKS